MILPRETRGYTQFVYVVSKVVDVCGFKTLGVARNLKGAAKICQSNGILLVSHELKKAQDSVSTFDYFTVSHKGDHLIFERFREYFFSFHARNSNKIFSPKVFY